jgi:hypothetical protein
MVQWKELISIFMRKLSFLGTLSGILLINSTALAQTFGTPPLEVTDLRGTAGDSFINLEWQEANDSDDGVIVGYNIYYGTESVQEDSAVYTETKTVSSRTTYTLEDLPAADYYYLAVTALDDDGNESETYSKEIKVEMKSGAQSEVNSIEAPRLISARQITGTGTETEIEIIFTQAVKAEANKESFLLESMKTGRKVNIADVKIDSDIVTLIIGDGVLEGGTKYAVTPTSAVRNRKGISVEPGGANTVNFVAIATTAEPEVAPAVEPEVYGPVEAPETTPEPEQEAAPDATIIAVETTEEPALFAQLGDITPPEDATELKIGTKDAVALGRATITWVPSEGSEGDFAEQVLYLKEKGKAWEPGIFMPTDVNTAEVEIDLDTEYEVRVTSIDVDANESGGATQSFKTPAPVLAKSGPGMNIFAILAFLAGALMLRSAVRKD